MRITSFKNNSSPLTTTIKPSSFLSGQYHSTNNISHRCLHSSNRKNDNRFFLHNQNNIRLNVDNHSSLLSTVLSSTRFSTSSFTMSDKTQTEEQINKTTKTETETENNNSTNTTQYSTEDDVSSHNVTTGTHHIERDPISGEEKSHRLSFEIPEPPPSDLETRQEDFDHCRKEVRQRSHEHGVFAGSLGEHQNVYYVLQALNYETMRIREAVSMSNMASLRMTWWRDTVKNALRGHPERQPVIRALSSIGKEYNLKWRHLKPLFDWREKELFWTQPPDIKTLEDYSEGVYSTLMYSYLHCLGVKNIHADHAASHLGKALGLSIMLRATPYHVVLRRTFLPASIMAKHHVSEEMLFRGENNNQLEEVVFEVANQAKQHLDLTRSMHDKVPKEAYPVLYPATMVDTFLDRLQKYNFNIFVQELQPDKSRLSWSWNYFKTVYLKKKY